MNLKTQAKSFINSFQATNNFEEKKNDKSFENQKTMSFNPEVNEGKNYMKTTGKRVSYKVPQNRNTSIKTCGI